MRIEMKDGSIQSMTTSDMVAYTCVPFREWYKDIPYS